MGVQPNALKQAADAAHALYSEKFKAREGAETSFAGVARRRESLRAAGDDAESKYGSTYASCLADCLDNPASAASSVASLGPLRDAVGLLRDAEAHFAAYTYADAQRSVIVARIQELESHITAENSRLSYFEQRFHDAVLAAAELDPTISVTASGGVADKLRELVARLSAELTRARAALVQHDTETEAARAALED